MYSKTCVNVVSRIEKSAASKGIFPVRGLINLSICRTILGALLFVVVGCNSSVGTVSKQRSADETEPFQIVTTCGMVTDIVEQVVGEKARVTGLLRTDVDPHLHEPNRNDVSHLMKADVIFYSGLMLEGRMTGTFASLARKGKHIHAVAECIGKSYLREPAEFEGHPDPHVWMDVNAWSQCVGFVATTLAEYDPTNAEYYQQNANAYREKLKLLDDYVKKVIATIPEQQRVLVTAHDAFGYFSRAYQIQVQSPQGISTESEAGVDDINRLVDMLVERRLQAIFVESTVNPKTLQAVIEGAASRGHTVVVGGELFSDAMGSAGTYEGTYIGMIDHNATIITRGLGGSAPQNGMNGKLSQ